MSWLWDRPVDLEGMGGKFRRKNRSEDRLRVAGIVNRLSPCRCHGTSLSPRRRRPESTGRAGRRGVSRHSSAAPRRIPGGRRVLRDLGLPDIGPGAGSTSARGLFHHVRLLSAARAPHPAGAAVDAVPRVAAVARDPAAGRIAELREAASRQRGLSFQTWCCSATPAISMWAPT